MYQLLAIKVYFIYVSCTHLKDLGCLSGHQHHSYLEDYIRSLSEGKSDKVQNSNPTNIICFLILFVFI